MDNGGIEPGWIAPPPPEIGSPAWKYDIAFKQTLGMLKGIPERSCVLKMMPCAGHEIGYFVVCKKVGGWDCFRVDSIVDIYEESKRLSPNDASGSQG